MDITKNDLIVSPLWYHTRGLMQTASGYGRKLSTEWKIKYAGRLRRIYCCCFSNSGSLYIIVNGKEKSINII